jgi:hypothetical protein
MLETRKRRRPALRMVAGLAAVAAALTMVVAPVDQPVARADAAGRGGDFVPLSAPYKIYDTRTNNVKLKAGATASFAAVNVGGVPATGVSGLMVRVIAAAPTANTWITIYSHNTPRPSVSTVYVMATEQQSNVAIVRPGANGQLTVYNAYGDTHVIVDVQGYFTSSTGSTNGGLVPITQKRVVDTRITGGIIPANGTRTIDLAPGGIPVGASAAFLSLTVPPTSTQPGYFSAAPTGVAISVNGVLNYENGIASSSGTVVPLTTDTRVTFKNWGTTPAHLIVDTMAYFSKTATVGAGLRPAIGRLYGGYIPANGFLDVQVGGTFGLPTRGIAGAMLSVQGGGAAAGVLRVWPTGEAEPPTSHAQHQAGAHHRSSVIVRPGTDGKVRIENQSTAQSLVYVDLEGWFAEPQPVIQTPQDTPLQVLQAKIQSGQAATGVVYSYVDNLGKVMVAYQADPDIYSAQYQTISGNEAFAGPPALSHGAGGTVQVSMQYGDGGDVWTSTQTALNAPTWTPMQDLGGSLAHGPAAANLADGTTVVFAVDVDGKLWAFVRSGTVPYWRNLGDQDLVGTPTTTQARDGVQVFVRAASGAVKSLVFRNDLTVSPWLDLGGDGSGTVAAVTYPGYRLAVFARSADGTIATMKQDTVGVFPSAWTPVGTGVSAGAPAAIIDPNNGRTWVVHRKADGDFSIWAETTAGSATYAEFQWNGLGVASVIDPTVAQISTPNRQYWVIAYRTINGSPRVVTALPEQFAERSLPAR